MSTSLVLAVIDNPFLKFGVNWYDFISQAISFLIIAWVLNHFVFKPVMATVAARQKEADEAHANSERIRLERLAAEAERKAVLQKAQEQAEIFISEAKANVAELLNQEKIRCEQLGNEMMAKAHNDALQEQVRLKRELKAEIANMVVDLTARLAQSNLSAADRERLLKSAISEIAAPAQGRGL